MIGWIKRLFRTETVDLTRKAVSETLDDAKETVQDAAGEVTEAVRDQLNAAGDVISDAGEAGDILPEAANSPGSTPPAEDVQAGAAPQNGEPEIERFAAYIDRDEFNLPRSGNIQKAVEVIKAQHGKPGLERALRVFEYAMAASLAYDLRVDREILALAALFSVSGENAGEQAYAFAIKQGMWDALAEKVKNCIEHQADGSGSDDRETRALALGVAAEAAGGHVPYIHGATSAETKRRHAA